MINNKQKQEIIKKWKESGFLDDIDGLSKPNIASLMECEASKLLKEQTENLKLKLSFILENNPRGVPSDKDGAYSFWTIAILLDITKKELSNLIEYENEFEIIQKRFSKRIRLRPTLENTELPIARRILNKLPKDQDII